MGLTYHLDNVLPLPLKDAQLVTESVWNSSTLLNGNEFSLLKASSGTGKSSFVAFLYGLRSDYTGEISLNGKSLKKHTSNDWAQLRQKELAIVWQELRLFPELTGRENIAINTKLSKESLAENGLENMAADLGISHKLDQPCNQLSMGQQQRVALIRALMQPFSFLILDEPFSHLDKDNTQLACNLIEDRCKKLGAGVLITSLGEDYPLPFNNTYIL